MIGYETVSGKGTCMRVIPIVLMIAALSACQSRTPMPWQQAGKTTEETKADEAACLQQVGRASEGERSTAAPSDALDDCMKRKGYHQDPWNRFACCRRLLGS